MMVVQEPISNQIEGLHSRWGDWLVLLFLRLRRVLLQLRGGRGAERDLLQPRWALSWSLNITERRLKYPTAGSSPPADLLWTVNGEKVAAGYSGLYKHSVLQIYDQSDSRGPRQSGINFEVREEWGREGGRVLILFLWRNSGWGALRLGQTEEYSDQR